MAVARRGRRAGRGEPETIRVADDPAAYGAGMTPSLRLIERYRRGEIGPEQLTVGLTQLEWSSEQVAALVRRLSWRR